MNHHFYFNVTETAIGPVTVVVNEAGAVTEVFSSDASARLLSDSKYLCDPSKAELACEQLREYAMGERKGFELKLEPKGTQFQHLVWEQLLLIPYGETRSYGQLAAILGNPNASRAVGRANATNPIGIIVPCHRVIGNSGDLTGYAGGLPMKKRLLELEGVLRPTLFD